VQGREFLLPPLALRRFCCVCAIWVDFAASRGSVKDLMALIVSRTVHMPTAKNNTGGAMLSEARDACAATAASLCRPVAPHDETGVKVDANGVNGDGANSVNGDGVHGYDVNDDGDGEGEDQEKSGGKKSARGAERLPSRASSLAGPSTDGRVDLCIRVSFGPYVVPGWPID
jgi:hypothetical protein